jgi:very-short-patch-repair endonuclease
MQRELSFLKKRGGFIEIDMDNNLVKTTTRMLRKNQTAAESILWGVLRNRKLSGRKFLRQYPIKFHYENNDHFFVADFYCAEFKLVIEIDGEIHLKQIEKDKIRDGLLKQLSYTILRFTNDEVENNIESVKTIILSSFVPN